MAQQMPPGAVFQRGGKMKKLLFALLACLLWQSDLAAQTPFYQGHGNDPGRVYRRGRVRCVGADYRSVSG
jgi:hypothetical protein